MHVGLIFCSLSFDDVPKPMPTGHMWCSLVDAMIQRLKIPVDVCTKQLSVWMSSIIFFLFVGFAFKMRRRHVKCVQVFDYISFNWLVSLSICADAMSNVCSLRCFLRLADVTCSKHTSLCWWFLLLLTSMSPRWLRHSMGYECKSLDIFVWCFFLNVHKPHQICNDLGWWNLSLADIAWPMHAGHNQFSPVDAHTPCMMHEWLIWC